MCPRKRKKRPAAVQRFYLMMPKNDPKDIVIHWCKTAATFGLIFLLIFINHKTTFFVVPPQNQKVKRREFLTCGDNENAL